jgi:SPP1 gp7 family putative phage head morphogenesis protein
MPLKREYRGTVSEGVLNDVERAYLIVLRAVHRQAVGSLVEDAPRKIRIPAVVLRLIERALRSLVRGVNSDLSKLPGVRADRLAGDEATVLGFRAQSVKLIRTIATEHLSKVERILSAGQGLHRDTLAKRLQEQLGVSASRAKFWAVDQTLKLNADVRQKQHERLGVKEYIWRTSQDGNVRPYHRVLNGKVFRYDAPPVVSASGRRAHPGHDYRCRCHAEPVLPKEQTEKGARRKPRKPTAAEIKAYRDSRPKKRPARKI